MLVRWLLLKGTEKLFKIIGGLLLQPQVFIGKAIRYVLFIFRK